MKKVMFISSTGGHLSELLQLKPLFTKYDSYLFAGKISRKNIFFGVRHEITFIFLYIQIHI